MERIHIGSSPRVWGQVLRVWVSAAVLGIIPTRVGTRKEKRKKERTDKDHPHACGDKRNTIKIDSGHTGSSPRVWGQDYDPLHKRSRSAIIPTRVGTRWYTAKLRAAESYHPHACGDKTIWTPQPKQAVGSSPRVWGQVLVLAIVIPPNRIIPTRVGTSPPFLFCRKGI